MVYLRNNPICELNLTHYVEIVLSDFRRLFEWIRCTACQVCCNLRTRGVKYLTQFLVEECSYPLVLVEYRYAR